MKKETSFTTFVYIFGPAVRFILISEIAAAGMDFIWNLYLQERVLSNPGASYTHTALSLWSLLCILIPAAAGCLSVRREAQTERNAFFARHRKVCTAFEGAGRKRVMPLLLVAAVFLALGINVAVSLWTRNSVSQIPEGGLPGITGMLLQAVCYCFAIPFIEETVFRGILYPRLQRWGGNAMALFVSALLFAIYHGRLLQGIYAFFMGLVFAAAYEALGRFEVPWALHGACNLAILGLQWTDSYRAVCTSAWAAVFTGIAAGGFLTIYVIYKKTAE